MTFVRNFLREVEDEVLPRGRKLLPRVRERHFICVWRKMVLLQVSAEEVSSAWSSERTFFRTLKTKRLPLVEEPSSAGTRGRTFFRRVRGRTFFLKQAIYPTKERSSANSHGRPFFHRHDLSSTEELSFVCPWKNLLLQPSFLLYIGFFCLNYDWTIILLILLVCFFLFAIKICICIWEMTNWCLWHMIYMLYV